MKDADYYAENTGEFEELTDAQQEAVFGGGDVETSDTEGLPETTKTEEVTTSKEAVEESKIEEVSVNADTESEKDKEPEPTIMAKDGEHTIPYRQLEEARTKADQLEAFSAQQTKLIEDLQAAQTQDNEDGGTEAQDAIVDELVNDYPEVAEDLKPLIQKMIDDGVKKGIETVERQFNEKVIPIQQAAQEAANQARNDTILAAHPDGVDLYNDPKLKDWIDSHSPIIREAYNSIMEASTAEDMVGLFSAYKDANKLNESIAVVENKSITDKAKEIIAGTKTKTPTSMTEIPSTVPVDNSEVEVAQNMTQAQISKHLESKTPEQINAWMNKVM